MYKTHSFKTNLNYLSAKNATLFFCSQHQFLFLFNSTLSVLILISFSSSLEPKATFAFVLESSSNLVERILHPRKLKILPLSPFFVFGYWLLIWSWLEPHSSLCSFVLGSSRLIWYFTVQKASWGFSLFQYWCTFEVSEARFLEKFEMNCLSWCVELMRILNTSGLCFFFVFGFTC